MNFVVHGFLETVGIELQLEAATAGECILRKIYQSRGMYIGLTAAAPATAAMAHLGAVGGMLAVSTMLAELAMFFHQTMMIFALEMMDFVFKTMNSVFKMKVSTMLAELAEFQRARRVFANTVLGNLMEYCKLQHKRHLFFF